MKVYGNKKNGGPGLRLEEPEKRGRKRLLWMIPSAFLFLIIAAAALLHVFYIKPPELPQQAARQDGGTPQATPSEEPGESGRGEAVRVDRENGARKPDYYTVVLCGTDEGESRTDTIMVASIDTAGKKVNIVSVPRDTMLNVTWTVKKINSAYSIGGIDRLKKALEDILGFPVDFYATVNLKAFVEIVDAIGGVDFNVPQDMRYSDPVQNLKIDLKAGEQTLDGEKAMELIRFRKYPQGDIQRISVQQDFMKAVAKKLLRAGNITKINKIAGILAQYMETDLSFGNIVWFGEQLLTMKQENLKTYTLPGRSGDYEGLSYWLLDAGGVLDTVNGNLNPYTKDIARGDLDIVTLKNGALASSTGKAVLDPTASTAAPVEKTETGVSASPPPTAPVSPGASLSPSPTEPAESTATAPVNTPEPAPSPSEGEETESPPPEESPSATDP